MARASTLVLYLIEAALLWSSIAVFGGSKAVYFSRSVKFLSDARKRTIHMRVMAKVTGTVRWWSVVRMVVERMDQPRSDPTSMFSRVPTREKTRVGSCMFTRVPTREKARVGGGMISGSYP